MPRGSKPGERRGGRQRGTPNKKTLIKNALFLAAAADPNRSPLDFMLALMRDPQVSLDLRIDVAVAAAPFVHARPKPVRNKHSDPIDLKFKSLEVKQGADGSGGLQPLDFLLGVMSDPAASPRQRVKAAAIGARYSHAYAGWHEALAMIVVEDEFGFKVDPELARAERDDQGRERWLRAFKSRSAEGQAAQRELEQIGKRRAERVALVKFPDGYTAVDREADQKRLGALYSKRLSREKLTPEEEAEEAHLAVRVLNPEAKKVVSRLPRKPEMEWPMSRIAELEERFVVGDTPLTAAEADELNDLRGRYPGIAADVDKLNHQYRYWLRRETEIAEEEEENRDMDTEERLRWLQAHRARRQAVLAECGHLRDPRKFADVEELRTGPVHRIRELESLRFDEILTPEQAQELEELWRLYPEQAEKSRNFVVRRLSEHRANRDYMHRLGNDPGPIKQGEWPRIWTR
jgi:hypothetical protein